MNSNANQKTFLEVISEYLKEAVGFNKILEKNAKLKKSSYTLYEDLLLVYEYVNDNPEVPTKVIFLHKLQ